MDPDANLREQRQLARKLVESPDYVQVEDLNTDAVRLAELVLALDEWISRGGFLPARWSKNREE